MHLDDAKRLYAGVMVATPAPTTADGEIDVDAFRRNLRELTARGLRHGRAVILASGAAAEFPMLTVEQRKLLMRVAMETIGEEIGVAASVQSNSTREAVELAGYAHEIGIIGGQLSAPQYYQPTPDDIVQFFRDVAEQSGLPIIVYNNWWHVPAFTGEIVARLAAIDGIAAVKWSAPTTEEYLAGYDLFDDSLAVVDNAGQRRLAPERGAVGTVSHIANFWPEYALRYWGLMGEGRFAELEEELAFKRAFRAWEMRMHAFTLGEGPATKAAMAAAGLPSGDPLPPGRPAPERLRREVRDLFERYGVPIVAGAPEN